MKTSKKQLEYRCWFTGSNMPGYMPDEPPHPCTSLNEAREGVAFDIERDMEYLDESEEGTYFEGQRAALAELAADIRSGKCDSGFVGNRYYFIDEAICSAEIIEAADQCVTDYEPILDLEHVTPEELQELQDEGFDYTIKEARFRYHDGEDFAATKWYDDGDGDWYVGELAGGNFGYVDRLVHARSWETAYDIWIDERETVPDDEVHEAYDMTEAEFEAACERARDGKGEWPDLADGYSYQSDFSGTGIVFTQDDQLNGIRPGSVEFTISLDGDNDR